MLAGRIFQSLDLVQVMMIELFVDRLKRTTEIGKIHDPTGLIRYRAADVNLDAERMPVQAPALVILRHVRKAVRGFEGEDLEYFHEIDQLGITGSV